MIRLYTDGAWRKKEKAAGGAAVIIYENGKIATTHSYLGDVTNNCAELRAIKIGLEEVLRSGRIKEMQVTVYSDSTYAIGILTQNWKAKANKQLIQEIKAIMAEFSSVEFNWVKGHGKDRYNRLADLLANIAIDQHFGRDIKYPIPLTKLQKKKVSKPTQTKRKQQPRRVENNT